MTLPDPPAENIAPPAPIRLGPLDRPYFYLGCVAITALFLCGLVVWGFRLLGMAPTQPVSSPVAPTLTVTEVDIQPVIVPTIYPTQTPIRFPAPSPVPTPSVAPKPTESPTVIFPLGGVDAFHRDGQTFLTWNERSDLQGERYRIYRASSPIRVEDLNQSAVLLAEVSAGSANFYANRFQSQERWSSRYSYRLMIEKDEGSLPAGTGLFVWTDSAQDFGGAQSGEAYYAVTLLLPAGTEYYSPADMVGPVVESVADPTPVEISESPGIEVQKGEHVFIQYMDYRHWNPTFHAPNATNEYLGFSRDDPVVSGALAYAYDYVIYEPTPELCGGKVPDSLPVLVFLHGWKGNRYAALESSPYSFCGYGVFPFDESETWYFGFARDHDYRLDKEMAAGDIIENFTEQRVLRMVYDLLRRPPGPAADPQRVYVAGHSMGGSGALAFAQRYPNVFAAAYSAEPITNYLTAEITHVDWAADAAIKWGLPELNLPIILSAPAGWADHLQKYNGVGVWDWQNYAGQYVVGGIPGRLIDTMVPFGIDHGIPDHVVLWKSQGKPVYTSFNIIPSVWAGSVTWNDHDFSDFTGLPPSLGKIVDHGPFWNFRAIRDETVPGMSKCSANLATPPETAGSFNQTIKWSSSWDPWDGAPLDQYGLWRMSFCSVSTGSFTCGTGKDQTVDITPKRLQGFTIIPGVWYDWENRRVNDNSLVASGSIKAGEDGLLTIPGFLVTPAGNRLTVRLH